MLLIAFGTLRPCEMLALSRADVDVMHRTVRVRAGAHEIAGQGRVVTDPKSEAGFRTVTIPRVVAEALEEHLAKFAARSGVATKELMARMGHSSPKASLTYQHATAERDRAVADYLDQQIATAKPDPIAPVVPLKEAR